MKTNRPEIQSRGKNSLRILSVVLAALAGAAYGQAVRTEKDNNAPPPAGEVVTMDVFEVKTDGDIGYMSQNAAEVTRMSTPIEDIPMNITVFNQQFIEDLVATDTSELLAYDASTVKTSADDSFIARGFTSVGTNFLNGFAQATGFGFQPLANVERVEVIRGPAAILYGAGAYGATYNRVTKRPREQPFTNVRSIYTDTSLFRAELDTGSLVPLLNSRRFLWRVNAVHEKGETWFHTKKKELVFAPSLSWQPSNRLKLILEYFYNRRQSQALYETPVLGCNPDGITTLDGVFHSYGNRRLNWVEEDDFRRQTRQFATYDLRIGILRNLHFRSQLQWETKRHIAPESFVVSAGLVLLRDAALMPRYWREYHEDGDGLRTRNELVWQGKTWFLKHRMLAGFGWIEQETTRRINQTPRNDGGLTDDALAGDGKLPDSTWSAAGGVGSYHEYPDVTLADFLANPTLAGFNRNNIMPANLFDRAMEPPLSLSGAITTYAATDSWNRDRSTDWYANDIISFARDRVFLTGGIRYSEVERLQKNFLSGAFPNRVYNPNPTPLLQTARATVYSFGAVLHLDKARTFTLYGNMNNSFTPTYNIQPDHTMLKAETGRQKEAGLRVNALGGRLALLASYFDIKQENVTEVDPNKPPSPVWYRQIPGVRSQGFEFSANARLARDWRCIVGYSYTDARDESPGPNYGCRRDTVPRNKLTVYNNFNGSRGFLKNWSAGCGVIYTGSRPVQEVGGRGNEVDWGPVAAVWRVDASLGYRWHLGGPVRQMAVSLRVKNLFDNTDMFYYMRYNRYTVDPGRECQFVWDVRF